MAAVAVNASAAAFAAADGSATVVAVVVMAVFDAVDPLPSPNSPVAKVLPSAVPFSPAFLPAKPFAEVAAFAAAPVDSACAGTPWPFANAASAACSASCSDFGSVAVVFLPGVPPVVVSVAVVVPGSAIAAAVKAVAGSAVAGVAALFASA